jgi:hypothetical protein
MTSSTLPPSSSDRDGDADTRGRWRISVLATLTAVSVLIGGWIYVLFIYDPGLLIDELADRTFPDAAEQICAVAKDDLAVLPPASQATSAAERGEVVAASNVVLRQMIEDLRPLAPTEPASAAKGVNDWLDDWSTYISDREQYAAALAVDDQARFLESTKGSDTKGISRAIDGFAQVNKMNSCTTPGDVS